jgi:hypothetical protein
MSKIDRTTQVFREKIKAPYTPCAAAGMQPAEMQEFEITVWPSGAIFMTVGPLDRDIFQDGDTVKVIVQRTGKRVRFGSQMSNL